MIRDLIVPAPLWTEMWLGLRERGGGRHEAACVLGGRRSAEREVATTVVFLDDLPGTIAHRQFHRTPPAASSKLFEILRSRGAAIVADVHTHPGRGVGQSLTDAAHPIEYRVGLYALILPSFALGEPVLDGVGVHRYVGDGKWNRFASAEITAHIKIEP